MEDEEVTVLSSLIDFVLTPGSILEVPTIDRAGNAVDTALFVEVTIDSFGLRARASIVGERPRL